MLVEKIYVRHIKESELYQVELRIKNREEPRLHKSMWITEEFLSDYKGDHADMLVYQEPSLTREQASEILSTIADIKKDN